MFNKLSGMSLTSGQINEVSHGTRSVNKDHSQSPLSLKPKLLLVDDDPTYGKIMHKAATLHKLHLTYCKDMEDFAQLSDFSFDVAIVDYNLGCVNGIELTRYIESYAMKPVPVILVSQTQQRANENWPNSIREFIYKENGPTAVINAACKFHREENKTT